MIEWRDVVRFSLCLVGFAALETIRVKIFGGEPAFDTALAMASMFTVLGAVREPRPSKALNTGDTHDR